MAIVCASMRIPSMLSLGRDRRREPAPCSLCSASAPADHSSFAYYYFAYDYRRSAAGCFMRGEG